MSALEDRTERAWNLRMSDPQTARQLAEQSREHPGAAIVLAYAQWRASAYDEALTLIGHHEEALRTQEALRWLARAIGIRGDVLLAIGQERQALSCFQEQFRLAQQVQDVEMEGLAHNDTGVLLIWDDPERAAQRFQLAYELFKGAGAGHEANLGLCALNLSVAHRELGHHDLSDIFLREAEALILSARAWPYWIGVINQRLLRLAGQHRIEEARQLVRDTQTLDLPEDSRHTLQFFYAKAELEHGNAQAALTRLKSLTLWLETRQDMLDDYLDALTRAQHATGDLPGAYDTLRQLLQAVKARHARERTTELKTLEVMQRTAEAHKAASALRAQAATLQAMHQSSEELSLTDELTGVSNRRQLTQWTLRQREKPQPLTIAFIDIDNFKRVNDQYGHTIGDQVLRTVARLMHRLLQPSDLIVRLGGDEFVVIRPSAQVDEFQAALETLRQACQDHAWPMDAPVTLSIGLTPGDGDLDTALRAADRAMYTVKAQGKNQVLIFPSTDE
ncbi:GGDEF domain-containing protein [Deinococcus ruber]|nr:diguanylate cyclase [Deinococcus ruber]